MTLVIHSLRGQRHHRRAGNTWFTPRVKNRGEPLATTPHGEVGI